MTDQPTSYTFTERERTYFERLLAQFNASVSSGVSLICTQQDLDGQWRLNADGSGIERADRPEYDRLLKEMHAVA